MGVREYARHAGVSHTAVQKAIAEGRIRNAVFRDEKGRPKIDPELADTEWKRSTTTTHPHARHAEDRSTTPPPGGGRLSAEESKYPPLAQSRAIREGYQAQLAKLDYDERSGKLVRVDDVKVRAFQVARRVRDALLNVPVRVVDEIAAVCGDLSAEQRHEILLIMQREQIQALEELRDSQTQP